MQKKQEEDSSAAGNPSKALQDLITLRQKIIDGGRLVFRTEEELHSLIHERIGPEYIHEFRFSKTERFDFFRCDNGIVIEIKSDRNTERKLFYQIERYTRNKEISGCLVVAPIFKGMIPDYINDKPIARLPLWRLRL